LSAVTQAAIVFSFAIGMRQDDSRRHLAETAAALMWPRVVVAPDPFIGIRGKFPARKSAIEPWSLSQKAMQWNSFNMVL
jgi:hypothetical protein